MSIGVGVVGFGYWGPNMLRNVAAAEGLRATVVVDARSERLALAQRLYPGISAASTYQEMLQRSDVQAVVIATQLDSHYEIAKASLLAGKHVLIGKPMTATVEQGEELCELAERLRLVLMVDHTFLFTGAVDKMKELIAAGEIGSAMYFDSVRVNLGLIRPDHNVLWDLAPHDLSILLYLINERPLAVSAVGACHVRHSVTPLETIAYLAVRMTNNVLAHIHVNWLSPVKVRKTLIAGDKRMLVYDDLEPDEKIKIYDKGIDITQGDDAYQVLVQYRTGDIRIPKISAKEALQAEMEHFRDCILTGLVPKTHGQQGLDIVRMLVAAEVSLHEGGRFVDL